MSDTPDTPTNGVRITNREIYDMVVSVKEDVRLLVDADLPRRMSSLERWRAATAGCVAFLAALMPFILYFVTRTA